ncbi:MAG: tetratricopeptide repeat protein [Acidobacteriales bacterium]|nr:tetratricopeptide repeat protein [Terriglobales bacterium]
MPQPGKLLRCCSAIALSAAALWGQSKEAEIRAHLEQAEKASQQGDFHTAASEYRKVVELDPTSAETHARLGMIYNRLGKLPESTESYERALRLDPKLPRVNVLLALNYIAAGGCRDAIPLLAANFEAEANSPVRLLVGQRLVECYFATGDQDQGLALVQKLRQIGPDDPDVLYTALKTYMNLWNEAFQRLTAKAPDSYRTHQVLAESLEAQERFAEAANEYREILKLAPQLPGMHYQLGRMILRSDSSTDADQRALAEFQKELEASPAAPPLVEVGEIHLRRKQPAEASGYFSRAVQLEPGYVPARIGLAKVFVAEQQWPKALEQLEAAAKLAPEDEAVAYNLMLTYRGLGRTADAKRAYDTFQRLKTQRQQSRAPLVNPAAGAPAPGRGQ